MALPLSKEDSVLSTNSDKARVVEWPSLNPNWELLRILSLVKKLYKRLYIACSLILFVFDKSEIGL